MESLLKLGCRSWWGLAAKSWFHHTEKKWCEHSLVPAFETQWQRQTRLIFQNIHLLSNASKQVWVSRKKFDHIDRVCRQLFDLQVMRFVSQVNKSCNSLLRKCQDDQECSKSRWYHSFSAPYTYHCHYELKGVLPTFHHSFHHCSRYYLSIDWFRCCD